MWLNLVTTGAVIALGAGLSVPLARNFMLGDVENDWLSGELELDCIAGDGCTVELKTGDLFQVYKIRGINYDAKIGEEQLTYQNTRAELIHQLGSEGLTVRTFGVKREHDISIDAEWPCQTLEEIAEAEKKLYRQSYSIEWWLLIGAPNEKPLVEGGKKINSLLGQYDPQLIYSAPENEVCELTCFLNYLLCGEKRTDLEAITQNLSEDLPASDFQPEDNGTISTFVPLQKYQKILTIYLWPETSSGIIFNNILSLPGDVEVSQVSIPYKQLKTIGSLKREMNQNTGFMGSPAAINSIQTMQNKITDGKTTLFETQTAVILRADTRAALDKLVAETTKILGARRILTHVETAKAPDVWFNRIPGREKLIRPLHLDDEPLAALWPFHYASTGESSSPLGPYPIRQLRSPSGEIYNFQFHLPNSEKPLGNFLVIGGSGGGKSTLIMHLFSGLAKFAGVAGYVFDSNNGAQYMIESMGGIYQSFDKLSLNPLDVGEDTKAHRQRVNTILRTLLSIGHDAELNNEDDEAIINHAIELAFSVDVPDRTLNNLYEVAFPKRSQLRKKMAKWVIDEDGNVGMHSHIFNAEKDILGNILSNTHLMGMNMNEALNDPVIGPSVVTHTSAAIKKVASGQQKGFAIFIDEAANLLQNDGFKGTAKEMYREYRKLGGMVGMAFQDPKALQESGISSAIIENTATFIFFPNAGVNEADLAPFNLNEEQIRFIRSAGATGQQGKNASRQVLIVKRDSASGFSESAIVDVNLAPLGEALRFYKAGSEANQDLQKLKDTWGDTWPDHL